MYRDTHDLRRSAPRPLTTTAIAGLKPGKTLADGAIRPGHGSLKFRKRVTATSVVPEWIFEWSHQGKTVRITLARYSVNEAEGTLTLTQARAEASRLQDMVRRGENPKNGRELERAEARQRQDEAIEKVRSAAHKTVAALANAYLDSLRRQGKKDSAYDAAGLFRNHLERPFPDMWGMPAARVTPEHVKAVLVRLVGPHVIEPKGRTALKLRSYLGAAFQLALGSPLDPMEGSAVSGFDLSSNPVLSVPATKMAARFNRTGKRSLSPGELRHYIAHLYIAPHGMPRLALLLQLVSGGQRLQQLLRLRVRDVNEATFTLHDPKGKRTKAREHVLPLVPEVEEILTAARAASEASQPDDFIFSTLRELPDGTIERVPVAPESLSGLVQGISISMLTTHVDDKPLASEPFRAGDVRRSIETLLAAKPLSLSKDLRAQLLSHGLGGIQDSHYDMNEYIEEKREALSRWNNYWTNLCIGEALPTGANVVALTTRGAA